MAYVRDILRKVDPSRVWRLALRERLARIPEGGSVMDFGFGGLMLIRARGRLVLGDQPLAYPALCVVMEGASHMVGLSAQTMAPGSSIHLVHMGEPSRMVLEEASPTTPFVALWFTIHGRMLGRLLKIIQSPRATAVTAGDEPWLRHAEMRIHEALWRLMRLVDHEDDRRLLGPPIIEELCIHALRSPLGPDLLHHLKATSQDQGALDEVIGWIKDHYQEPCDMESLARMARMSTNTFYTKFKAMTGHTPLNFIKKYRLHNARGLLASGLAVNIVSYRVGYTSVSQFCRDYKKHYGHTASRDSGTRKP